MPPVSTVPSVPEARTAAGPAPRRELPECYRILAESVELVIPGFADGHQPSHRILSVRRRDCGEWFQLFFDRVSAACGRAYLPVLRLGDGELNFLLGDQKPDIRLRRTDQARQVIKQALGRAVGRGFRAFTFQGCPSGLYSRKEWVTSQKEYGRLVCDIGRKGILALPLHFGGAPFCERYFPALGLWLRRNGLRLTDDNYVPFYFPYAALTGPRRGELLRGRRVLAVNGAAGTKRDRIEATLMREGVATVQWLNVSPARSLFDRLNGVRPDEAVDLVLVGAGIGKPNVFAQLEVLGVPCIDAGFVFEVWADSAMAVRRPYCLPSQPGVDSA